MWIVGIMDALYMDHKEYIMIPRNKYRKNNFTCTAQFHFDVFICLMLHPFIARENFKYALSI